MLKVIIIEDEPIAMEQLTRSLHHVVEDVHILARASTVAEGIDSVNRYRDADIIFSDVQLGDGLSFQIFENADVKVPVVFVTGYDHFMLNAFEHNGIDYLLKPLNETDLGKSIAKYRNLSQHFMAEQDFSLLHENFRQRKPRSRIVVHKGMENVSLRLSDIVMFYTEQKLVYCITSDNKKYICDGNLSEIEEKLDQRDFFRVNRQYILNIEFIRSYRSFDKVKLRIDLLIELSQHQIIVSQETAPLFRRWMMNN